jgi:hypothetical protein
MKQKSVTGKAPGVAILSRGSEILVIRQKLPGDPKGDTEQILNLPLSARRG